MQKIPCTLGILTYNSAGSLEGALESVKDFAEILIADGGSTDATLEIAQKYGCRIISQSNPGHRIQNFSLERNRMVDAATYDWFFYIDSDERASLELVDAIRGIVTDPSPKHLIYWVCFRKTTPDFTKVYRTFKEYYQPRFFNRTSGARFNRPMHERIVYDERKYSHGRIHAPWYVSLEPEDLNWGSAMAKSRKRLKILADAWTPKDITDVCTRIFARPVIDTGKSIIKMLYVLVRYPRTGVPIRYELLRIYSHWTNAYMSARRFLHIVSSKNI